MNSIRCLPMLIHVAIILLICCSIESKKSRNRARKVREDKPRRFKVTPIDSTIRLRCDKKDIIYSIDIISYKTRSDSQKNCSGLQPNVLTESINCYWGRKCYIVFSNVQPIVKTCCVECVGSNPNILDVSYLCLRKDKVKFLDAKGNVNVTSDNGMLVSHKDFPWHYRYGIHVKMILKPRDKSKRKLFLMTYRMDIAKYDALRMEDRNGKVHFTSTNGSLYNATTPAGQFVRIHFNTSSDSSGAQGFVYCYYWATSSFVPNQDICQLVRGPKNTRKRKRVPKRKEPAVNTAETREHPGQTTTRRV